MSPNIVRDFTYSEMQFIAAALARAADRSNLVRDYDTEQHYRRLLTKLHLVLFRMGWAGGQVLSPGEKMRSLSVR